MKYITEEDINSIKGWIRIYSGWQFGISIDKAGYFDERPLVHVTITQLLTIVLLPILLFINSWFLCLFPLLLIGYGKMYINLPIKTGIQDCDSAKYGIAIHNNTFWIYIGGGGNFEGGTKWVTWDFPFFTKEWVRTSILLKDDTWEHEIKGNRKQFYNEEWKRKQKSWAYDFTDKYDGEIILTTIYVEEREWRPKWLKWTKLFADVNRTIDVHFSKECGKKKGSWKGGTLGCGYTLLPNEDPLDCLKRLERDRTF